MAETEQLVAQPRDERGTRSARRLRSSGQIPAILYGHESGSVALTLRADQVYKALRHGAHLVDLQHREGGTEKALFREVQWDTFGQQVLHVDLARVDADERITVEVPIELRGTAPGANEGGRLEQNLHSLEVECLATAIPDTFRVSINELQINESITVDDLEVPAGVAILNPPDLVVVQVTEVIEEEADEEEYAPVEPELIRKEKEEEAADE